MSVGEASDAWCRVFFVGFYGGEVVLVGWWLREDCVELFPSCLYVGNVGEGFPDEVGEVGGDLEVGYFRLEGVPGKECGGPVGVLFVQGTMVFWGSTEVPLELSGRGLEALNWVSEVFTVGAREIAWVKWGRKISGEKFD